MYGSDVANKHCRWCVHDVRRLARTGGKVKCNSCNVAGFREGEALCFCLGCIQKMNAGSMYEMGIKLATATAELEKAKGREADMRRKSIAETVEWAASTVDKLARESLSADGSEYLDDIGPALESAAETIRQKAGPT